MLKVVHEIDATNKSLGRLASEVAVLLRGKNKPDFVPHKDGEGVVVVKNADKIKITGRKLKQKVYYHYTGYPGGLRRTTIEQLIEKKGMSEVLKKAVWGMLPKNKLRAKMIKRLKIVAH